MDTVHPLRHGRRAAGLARHAASQVTPENAERVGINFGSGIGGLPLIEAMHDELLKNGPRRISPFFIPGSIINMIAGILSIETRREGPEPRHGHRLHHLDALHRRGGQVDPLRRSRRDDRGRRRGGDHRARDRRLRRRRARCPRATTIRPRREPPLGQGARRLRAGRGRRRGGARGVRARARRAARTSTASWSATACRPTRTT